MAEGGNTARIVMVIRRLLAVMQLDWLVVSRCHLPVVIQNIQEYYYPASVNLLKISSNIAL